MSAISSASHPTFSYQIDPLLNISPLIDLYSKCLTHVVDTDGLFHLLAHNSPIILSHKRAILNSSLSYQKSFAKVRSPRCLLTIASLFFSWNYLLKSFREYIVPQGFQFNPYAKAGPTPARNFTALYPQSYILVTNQSAHSIHFNQHDNSKVRCYASKPLFFILQLNMDTKSFARIFGVLSADKYDTLSFNCSALGSCRDEMERTITVFAEFFHTSWTDNSYKNNSNGRHPFRRTEQVGIKEAMTSFLIGQKDRRSTYSVYCVPHFLKSYSNIPSPLMESFPVSRTPAIRFVTTAGVFTSQSSYHVYFSPFLLTVWLCILISAGTCLAVMVSSFWIQSQRVEIGLLRLTTVMAHWIVATAVGQYHHSGIPYVSRSAIGIVAPVVVSWFILSTFLINVYSAIFSSDATRSFYYFTNYTNYLQLPLDTMTYVLVNESYIRQKQDTINAKDSCANYAPFRSHFVCLRRNGPAACAIPGSILYTLEKLQVATVNITSVTERNRKITQQQRRLNDERLKSWRITFGYRFECANTETLSRLLRSGKPMVFLMPDHDFQKYWQLFVQLMQRDPTIKVANNFYSDASVFSQMVGYKFTSGLHPALLGSVVTRMKILLSSGIYGLWEKWHRIRYTDGGIQHDVKKLPSVNRVDPLSFDNSGTPWVFQAQAIAWLVATAVLMVEIIIEYLQIARVGVIRN